MSATFVFATLFGLLIVLILLRVPVSFSLALAVLPILFLADRVTPVMLLQRMMRSYGSFILLSVPFFILAAKIMNASGITQRLIRMANVLVGWLPGGLGHINVAVSMLFAGISGSSQADAAGIGSVLIPAMIKQKYDARFTVAVTACSAVMGTIIPPSINMVVWGGVLNVSVGALFLAGILPGIILGLSQMGLVAVFAYKRNYPVESKASLPEFVSASKDSMLAMLTPIIIIGGIVGGLVTPTEASLVAVLYSAMLGFLVYKSLKHTDVAPLLLETIKLASIALFAVGTASIFGWVLGFFQIPRYLISIVSTVTTNPMGILFIVATIFLLVGSFMDAIPAIVILGPLLRPMAEAVQIHPLHFSTVGIVALGFGLITPPYGLTLLISSHIAGINSMEAMREVGVFLFVMLLVLVALIIFPSISLFIPRLLVPQLF